jgi:hypothetical protein
MRAVNIRHNTIYIEVQFRLFELEVEETSVICKTSKGMFDGEARPRTNANSEEC